MRLYAYSICLKRTADRDYTVVKIFALTWHLHSNFMLYNGVQKEELGLVDICLSIHWEDFKSRAVTFLLLNLLKENFFIDLFIMLYTKVVLTFEQVVVAIA